MGKKKKNGNGEKPKSEKKDIPSHALDLVKRMIESDGYDAGTVRAYCTCFGMDYDKMMAKYSPEANPVVDPNEVTDEEIDEAFEEDEEDE